jgi:ParB family chromosome partitioning protein
VKVKIIPIELIKYPDVILRRPEDMTDIEDLAESIRDDGLLNPLTVIQKGEEYTLLAGGRRFEAVKLLGWKTVFCNVISPAIEREKIITLIENQKRADLNPLQEAQYYEYLEKELGLTQVKIGELSGHTAAHVNQMLSLLRLDEYTMGALAVGDISTSQARELVRCPDTSYRQFLVDIIKKNGASTLVLRRWIDQKAGFQSTAVAYQPAPVVVEGEGGETTLGVVCDACKQTLEYGGLQTISVCNECYRILKAAFEKEQTK